MLLLLQANNAFSVPYDHFNVCECWARYEKWLRDAKTTHVSCRFQVIREKISICLCLCLFYNPLISFSSNRSFMGRKDFFFFLFMHASRLTFHSQSVSLRWPLTFYILQGVQNQIDLVVWNVIEILFMLLIFILFACFSFKLQRRIENWVYQSDSDVTSAGMSFQIRTCVGGAMFFPLSWLKFHFTRTGKLFLCIDAFRPANVKGGRKRSALLESYIKRDIFYEIGLGRGMNATLKRSLDDVVYHSNVEWKDAQSPEKKNSRNRRHRQKKYCKRLNVTPLIPTREIIKRFMFHLRRPFLSRTLMWSKTSANDDAKINGPFKRITKTRFDWHETIFNENLTVFEVCLGWINYF